MRDTVNILYTGGWDSTFRLLQLSEYDIQIQPIYLKDPGRGGQLQELKAINNIFSAIKAGGKRLKFYLLSFMTFRMFFRNALMKK